MNRNGSGQTSSGITGGILSAPFADALSRGIALTPQPPDFSSAGMSAHDLRVALRNHYKQRRAGLSAAKRAAADKQIAARLADYVAIHHTHTIAAFAATPTEVDLEPWIRQHLDSGGRVALPRVQDQGLMEFFQFDTTTPLEDNRFGIAEPVASAPHVLPEHIDAVLVPLVAFDLHGHRLGMGGGYYDRYLPRLTPGTPLIGVAFACQQHPETLPRQAWDVPLHAVVTENAVLEWPHN